MIRILLVFLTFLLCANVQAQTDSSHLRISLLTCGTGPEPWETFGHTGVRVTDSVRGTDNVYNYGTFNGYDENFLMEFTRGKLLYYLSYYSYDAFVREYSTVGRSVQEQVLLLDGRAKQAIYEFLQWNALEHNKYYKYDFFFDNCATRIRDVFPRALGTKFRLGYTLPEGQQLTFRNIINQYFYRVHWQRFGVNILLGSKIDKVMTNREVMFLPDFLSEGIRKAQFAGKPISTDRVVVVPGSEPLSAGINGPFILMFVVLVLTIIGLFHSKTGNVMTFLLLILSGLIGCFILVMWFWTDHQTCQDNFNLLWALPTNVFIALVSKKRKDRYALVAILLILLSLVLHLIGIQELPLFELSPFLLSLLLTYGMIYRKNKLKLY
jgi:hypothetical protein